KKGIPTEAQVLKETPYRYADKTFFEIDEVRNAVVEGLRISQILQYQGMPPLKEPVQRVRSHTLT
ncbi:MAG TPA: hypothetical protein VGZ00_11630, partial [Candidatus Baltobacteraceae bacterium]|nr:hypothetical protein [Candidatus Baltobacteraceae bacterium]